MYLLLCLLLFATPAFGELNCPPIDVPPSLQQLVGEQASYKISFLFFDEIAEGEISFAEDGCPGNYVAVMKAQSTGIAAFVSRERSNYYQSHMRYNSAETVLQSGFHEATIGNTKGIKRRTYKFNYNSESVHYRYDKYGWVREENISLKGRLPVYDFLTVFFNLRAGLLDRYKRENRYVVPAFTDRGFSEIIVDIITNRKSVPKYFPKGGTLWKITLDRRILDMDDGNVYAWFDENGNMARGIVENVIGLGDVKGKLRN